MQEEIRLLPEARKHIQVVRPQKRIFVIASIIFLGLVLAIYAVFFSLNKKREASLAILDQELANLEGQRDKQLENRLRAAKEQIALGRQLLKDHVLWSQGLIQLEQYLLPEVVARGLKFIQKESAIELQLSAPNYSVIARQVAAFLAHEGIEDIWIPTIIARPSGALEFTLELTIQPEQFLVSLEPAASLNE